MMMADGVVEGEGSAGGNGGSGKQEQQPSSSSSSSATTRARAAFTQALARAAESSQQARRAPALFAGPARSPARRASYDQALAAIFQDWENNLRYLLDFGEMFVIVLIRRLLMMMNFSVKGILITYISAPVVLPFAVLILCVQLFYILGPLACAAISSWRMRILNHGNNRDGTDSMADMMASLNIFYSLIIFQGTMFLVLLLPMAIYGGFVFSSLHSLEQLSDKSDKWGEDAIGNYLSHIISKCREDTLSIKGMDMIKYAAELLDSESKEDYLDGARLLSAFIKKGEDVSWVLLSSRDKIQRLIDSLRINSSLDETTEIRELAAIILADLAGHIDVARYPGALRYISSLFQEEATHTYWSRSKQVYHPRPTQRELGPLELFLQSKEDQLQNLTKREEERQWRLMRDQKRLGNQKQREGGNSNELILQGLTILERLASNSDNRRLICSTPGLLPKITAPLFSETLIQDVKTKAWDDIVARCLKVLHQLIRAPGWASRRLRHEIFSDDHALSNLKCILDQGNNQADHQELKLRAMEILTELALDLSINLPEEIKKVLFSNQLRLFLLANGEGAAIAGRAMVSLSTNSESNSALIMTTQNGIIGRLTEILDDKKNITRRTIAAEIMANLCHHCNVDNTMKEILLPKVLGEIKSIKIKSQERKISAGQNNLASGDEENQGDSVSTNNEEMPSISELLRSHRRSLAELLQRPSPTEKEEISDQEREEQEAFLSLAHVICDKLNSADLDGAIQNAVQNENNAGRSEEQQRREIFVDRLKTIVDENRQPTADCLRIVKLCGQISVSVMRCEQYVEIFRNKEFNNALSKASETMSKLESCMLFVGTDFGLRKTVRPLFSEIEEDLVRDVATKL